MIRVLLVEDDADIMKSVCDNLNDLGDYRIACAESAEDALRIGAEFDVILLDIMLPGRNGIELCGLLRKRYTCPIIFLSCLDDSQTIIEALGQGGDDYVVKPFDTLVLHARIQANLRRIRMERKTDNAGSILRCGPFEMHNSDEHVTKNGKRISLLPIESRLLAFLMQNEGRFYKAKELYREIWGQDDMGNVRTVLVHMHNLRAKIEDNPENPRFILNVRGKGYTFYGQDE